VLLLVDGAKEAKGRLPLTEPALGELTDVGVKLGVVQVVDNVFDGLDSTIPMQLQQTMSSCDQGPEGFSHIAGMAGYQHLEVAADEELASHLD
jgi:hypothetical protein